MEIFVGKNDKRYGPFPIEKVNESIANGEFSLDDLGWYEGLGEWKPLRNIEGIVGATVVPAVVSIRRIMPRFRLNKCPVIWCGLFFPPCVVVCHWEL